MSKKRVVVGMSGGVDSSVSALLLKQQGYDVIGMFMKNWDDSQEQTACNAALDYQDVISVCDRIGIPFYAVNFIKEYRDKVFADFLRESVAGNTPNPDILCNREIKFSALMDKALELGAEALATGHYCQTRDALLLKGADPIKDQSYFLHALSHQTLKKVIFPIGHLEKSEVRRMARDYGLSTAEKKDSTGICFIGERKFRDFLSQHLECQPGHFETLEGKVVGTHQGVAYYTIGQRKGMGIGGAGEAWFIVGKDVARRAVVVVQGTRHPALYCDGLQAKDLTWVSGVPPVLPYRCKSKIRYRQPDQECEILSIENGLATIKFSIPQRAVTPGQSIVFYDDQLCLGGSVITRAEPSYYHRKLELPSLVSC